MAFEIELKAKLEDHLPVKERVSALGMYCRSYTKSDSYWIPGNVRIRSESGVNADGAEYNAVLVTYKAREMRDGIEVNDEREFTVSGLPLFEELLSRLGQSIDILKEKQGWAWDIQPDAGGEPSVLAELSLVTGLGWFLELEILASDNSAQTVAKHRERLLSLLAKLEVPADQIEPMPYIKLLRESKK